jgi:hypothetical protein
MSRVVMVGSGVMGIQESARDNVAQPVRGVQGGGGSVKWEV